MTDNKSKNEKKPAAGFFDIVGAVAALTVAVFLFFSALDFGLALLYSDGAGSVFSPYLRNWLLLIFKLLAGIAGSAHAQLAVINPMDIAVLILGSLAGFATAFSLSRARRVVAFIASLLPLVGIVLLAVSGITGRSSLMLAIIVISICLAKTRRWTIAGTIVGVAAGAFLLTGDVCLGIVSSAVVTVLFGIGYVALIAWLALAALRLLRGNTAPAAG